MKSLTGKVISNKMQKTVVIEVETSLRHPVYQKVIRRRKKYAAHTEQPYQIGDLVELVESRPLSKTKRWTVKGLVGA